MPSEPFKISSTAERVLIMGAAGRDFHMFAFGTTPPFASSPSRQHKFPVSRIVATHHR